MAEPLTLSSIAGLGIATVMARRGVSADALGATLGHAAPDGPAAVRSGSRTMVGTGPGTWLVLEEGAAGDFAERLADCLAGLAGVSDQSSSYMVHALSGPSARALLQRGLAIDLDPSAFAPGAAAVSQIGHIGVVLWQVGAAPDFRIAVWRSYAESFRRWIEMTAASLHPADQGG